MKCSDVVLLDVKGLSQICDYIVVASGTSERQMKSVAQGLEKMGKEQNNHHYRSNRDTGNTWVVSTL
jgi:ribosome-associated protein